MNNYKVEFFEPNGSNILTPIDTVSNYTALVGTAISDNVLLESISISDETISALDTLQIEAKRLKFDIRLPHLQTNFSQAIRNLLSVNNPFTGQSRLLNDTLETMDENILTIRHDKAMAHFNIDSLFASEIENDGANPTYTSTALIIQSYKLFKIFRRYISNHLANGFDGYRVSNCTGVEGSIYSKHYPFDLLVSFLCKGFILDELSDDWYSSAQNQNDSLNTAMASMLLSIFRGTIDYDFFAWVDDSGVNNFDGDKQNSTWLWTSAYSGINTTNASIPASRYAWGSFANFLIAQDFTVIDPYDGTSRTSGYFHTVDILAIFFASIVKKTWIDTIKDEYTQTERGCVNIRRTLMIHDGSGAYAISPNHDACCNPFHYCAETILGRRLAGSNGTEYNAENDMFEVMLQPNVRKTIPCIKQSQNSSVPIMLGKVQTASFTETTTDGFQLSMLGIPVAENDGLFYPVRRYYKIIDSSGIYSPSVDLPIRYPNLDYHTKEYKYILDNIDQYELFDSPVSNSYLYLCNYIDKNWIYFDNIKCYEQYQAMPESGHYDYNSATHPYTETYPCFDEQNDGMVDEYDRFMYADFVEKYYEKIPSVFMNLYVRLSKGDEVLFTGIVDATSITNSQNQISIESVDSLGVVIENIKKLSGFVHFAQFDTGLSGENVLANIDSGATIYSAIRDIIKNKYPYKSAFPTQNFEYPYRADLPIGLKNKVLNEISTEDALLLINQCTMSHFYTDSNGEIVLGSVTNNSNTVHEIDENNVLDWSETKEINVDNFSIDRLKNIVGYRQFAPKIFAYFSQLNKDQRNRLSLTVYGYEEIKILDKIRYLNSEYIVIGISRNIFKNDTTFTLIGG